MEVSVNTLSGVSREVEIITSAEELKPHFEKAYKEFRPKVEIKGFRKGKAPLDIVKKLYGDMIEDETLPKIAGTLFQEAIKEKDLKPIGEPVIVDMDYNRETQFRVKIQYDIRPEIQLKKYKGISLEKPVYKVTDEMVTEEIERLRRIHSTLEEVSKVTDDDHIVSATVQEIDPSGLPLVGKKNQKARFYLADPQLEQPFKDALKETQKGSAHRIQYEHKHDGHVHSVNVQLNVEKVERVILPEVNNEFIEKTTSKRFSDVEIFKKSLETDLVTYWQEKSSRQTIEALASELLRLHDFEVPESLTRSVLESLLEEMKQQYPKKQLPDNFDIEKFNHDNRAYAVYQARWALLREELIKAENISADDNDFEKLAEREAAKIGIDKEKLINYYKASEQVKDRIVGDKLIEGLLSQANIKEVEKDPVTA